MKLRSKAEIDACVDIAAIAADHITDDWGEPLKDVDADESISASRLRDLANYVDACIRRIKFEVAE